MENNRKNTYKGASICTILTILFVILKLTGVIAWPWFWVLFPLILDLSLALIILVVVMVVKIIALKRN